MADDAYKKLNIRGGVTYSDFTYDQALKSNERSDPKYKKSDLTKVAPQVQLLLDKVQRDRVIAHLRDVYVPETIKRSAAGEKKDAFEKKYADKILAALEEWSTDVVADAPPHLPIKKVYPKTLVVAPWAMATLKFTGTKEKDLELLARVNDESELKVPDPNLLTFPVLQPIGRTVHDLYPGAWAYATLNLSGFFMTPGNYGISAYANTLVFLEDRDRLSGGAGLDEDDIFMDD